jgi:hypothetical protein
MSTSFSIRSITPVAASLLVGSLAVLASSVVLAVVLSSVALEATAAPQGMSAGHLAHAKAHAKGDRLPARVTGTACSTLGWPHYEQSCLFDSRRPAAEPRTVRVIALVKRD